MEQQYNQQIPLDALTIISQLEAAGYEAYIVGGCVRDMLMDREPNDWDITTSAKPEQVKAVFPRTYDTGIEHGTVTVILKEEHFEVTTYRIEGEYTDFRRPDKVSFVEDITLDLSRRDFTMNAIAYHPERGFIDPYKGRRDIENRCIRSVRDAKERFTEDALRILRAIRFSAVLGFTIEEDTIRGIHSCKNLLQHISKERVRDEFLKICTSNQPRHIVLLNELGLLEYIVPELVPLFTTPQHHPHHSYDVGLHTIVAMENSPQDVVVRLGVLFHDIGKPSTHTRDKKGIDHFYNHPQKGEEITKKVLKILRLDNQTIKEVSALVAYHDYHLKSEINRITIKHLLRVLGSELIEKLLIVQEADCRGQNLSKLPKKLMDIEKARALVQDILASGECYALSMLAVTGKDLIEAGIPKGKQIGDTLEVLLAYVVKEPAYNTKEDLLHYLNRM